MKKTLIQKQPVVYICCTGLICLYLLLRARILINPLFKTLDSRTQILYNLIFIVFKTQAKYSSLNLKHKVCFLVQWLQSRFRSLVFNLSRLESNGQDQGNSELQESATPLVSQFLWLYFFIPRVKMLPLFPEDNYHQETPNYSARDNKRGYQNPPEHCSFHGSMKDDEEHSFLRWEELLCIQQRFNSLLVPNTDGKHQ